MGKEIKPGDLVECITTGVQGVAIRTYWPTACAQQLIARTGDGRKYHAPYDEWRHIDVAEKQPPQPPQPQRFGCARLQSPMGTVILPDISVTIKEPACIVDVTRDILENARKAGMI